MTPCNILANLVFLATILSKRFVVSISISSPRTAARSHCSVLAFVSGRRWNYQPLTKSFGFTVRDNVNGALNAATTTSGCISPQFDQHNDHNSNDESSTSSVSHIHLQNIEVTAISEAIAPPVTTVSSEIIPSSSSLSSTEITSNKTSSAFTNVPVRTTVPLPSSPMASIRKLLGPKAVKFLKNVIDTSIETFQPCSIQQIADESGTCRTNVDYNNVIKTVFNAVLLTASFATVAYALFSIDASITRGWTQSEIAMRLPIDTWSSYEASLEDNPVYTKTLINVVIYLLGDWLSQTLFQRKNILDFDASRTIRNGFIGLCFGPLVHEYYQFSDYILPVEGGMWNRIQKIAMDQTIYLTVKCSIYIAAVGLLQGDDWETCVANVKNKIKPICFTAWKFWPLVHLITYNVIPARHRILWVNCVDLVWNAILATKAAATIDEPLVTESNEKDPSRIEVSNSTSTVDVITAKNLELPIATRNDVVMSERDVIAVIDSLETSFAKLVFEEGNN